MCTLYNSVTKVVYRKAPSTNTCTNWIYMYKHIIHTPDTFVKRIFLYLLPILLSEDTSLSEDKQDKNRTSCDIYLDVTPLWFFFQIQALKCFVFFLNFSSLNFFKHKAWLAIATVNLFFSTVIWLIIPTENTTMKFLTKNEDFQK